MTSRARLALPSLVAALPALVLSAELALADPIGPGAAAAGGVAWPPATGLLLSELMTGGASASDEFVELYDAGPATFDLGGLEVAYITASGGTVTRKAMWTAGASLGPGGHLLLANVAGIFAGVADATYSGGLAATGGSLVLRAAGGGSVLDAVAWGDATNAFVEGQAAAAPPAGQSLERLPGGDLGNGLDTNVNAADWFVMPEPGPQGLADPPILPPPPPSASSQASGSPEPSQSAEATPGPSGAPASSAGGTPSASPGGTPAASTAPPPTPSGPTGAPARDVADARHLPDGSSVVVEGVLTAPLGLTDAGRGGFLQDPTAGIALYLDTGTWPSLPADTLVHVAGSLDHRYGQTTLRVAAAADLRAEGTAPSPDPASIATGLAGEATEGSLVLVAGRVTAGPDALSDGFAVDLDDGSGALRVVAGAATDIAPGQLPRGAGVTLVGVLGQHDSGGTGLAGYRVYLRSPSDVTAGPAPTSAAASPTPTGASPRPSTSPTPTGAGQVSPIASILASTGARVRVAGVVTSPAATWGADGRRVTIEDASGAILVRLPLAVRAPGTGQRIEVVGRVGHYLGASQLAADRPPVHLGAASVAPRPVRHGPLGTSWTWRLAAAAGRVLEVRRGATSWRAELQLTDGSRLPVGGGLATLAAGRRIVVGALVAITGIVRPAASGATDRRAYVVGRSSSDVVTVHAATSGGGPAPAGGGAAGVDAPTDGSTAAGPLEADLADLPELAGRLVRVGGLVDSSVADMLLLEDGTAEAWIRLPSGTVAATFALGPGLAVNVVGIVGRAADGTWQVSTRSAADVIVVAQLDDPGSTSIASEPASVPAEEAPAASSREPTGPGVVGLALVLGGGLGLISALALAGRAWRRRTAARAVAAGIEARLDALTRPRDP
ncbi:MAG: hypothetical protein ACXVAP_00735 [Candidatus Limnocylindrales bacterium]